MNEVVNQIAEAITDIAGSIQHAGSMARHLDDLVENMSNDSADKNT